MIKSYGIRLDHRVSIPLGLASHRCLPFSEAEALLDDVSVLLKPNVQYLPKKGLGEESKPVLAVRLTNNHGMGIAIGNPIGPSEHFTRTNARCSQTRGKHHVTPALSVLRMV